MSAYIRVDEKGIVYDFKDQPIPAPSAKSFLKDIRLTEEHTLEGVFDQQQVIVEPYSFIYFVEEIEKIEDGKIHAKAQYGLDLILDLEQIYLDHKDRFIAFDLQGRAALLSEKVQDQIFSMADSYTDHDISIQGKTYPTPFWLSASKQVAEAKDWSQRYIDRDMGWDMGEPSPSLVWLVDKLKLPKMRVAVLGSGRGHDAHFMASKGHKVTGFDFSSNAIEESKKLYAENENLQWRQFDVFNLPSEFNQQFDLIVEHTCFCAIEPQRRDDLIRVWKKLLSTEGQVLGIFFVMQKTYGPPFGATEQEIFERLEPYFRVNMWLRSKASHPKRLGKELLALVRLK